MVVLAYAKKDSFPIGKAHFQWDPEKPFETHLREI